MSYPFLGFLADYGVLHSYDTKLEWLPWKFSGFETGFGLEFSPTLVSALLASSNDINLYYQMELYPITANFEFLIPIAKKRRWLGIKLGGGMLLTHAYQIFSYESDSSVYYGSDTSDLFSDLGIEDISDFSTKYGETYFINYMLQAGIFFRLVSYHGFVCDFDLDYVYWNISDFSMSNIVANFSIGFKI